MRVCACCVARTRGSWTVTFRWRHPCLTTSTSFVLRSARRASLLPGKSETVYTKMLGAVTDACTALGFNADRTTVVTDFEMAAMQAVTAVFGQQVHVQGCFFTCARVRGDVHVRKPGLTALYNADDVAKQFVGMLDGLALLPLADVPAGMAHLRANTPPQHLDDVIDYFDTTYVTGRHRVVQPPAAKAPLPPARLRQQPPPFAPDVWNVHVTIVKYEVPQTPHHLLILCGTMYFLCEVFSDSDIHRKQWSHVRGG